MTLYWLGFPPLWERGREATTNWLGSPLWVENPDSLHFTSEVNHSQIERMGEESYHGSRLLYHVYIYKFKVDTFKL